MDNHRVALITPPASLPMRYGKVANVGNTMASLGLAYLAAYIRQKGYQPFIIESPAFNLKVSDIVKKIAHIQPAYVGISSSTITIYSAHQLARAIKALLPETRVILGGSHVSAVPRETFTRFDSFDIGVVGEGEVTMAELLSALQNNQELSHVKGIVHRLNNGQINITERRAYIQKLDDLPFPAWDIIPKFPRAYHLAAPMAIKYPQASVETSRGCPFECLFCDQSVFGRQYRSHSMEYVLEMFKVLTKEYQVKHIMVYDDNFLVDKERVQEICRGLISNKIIVKWSCQGTTHLDQETVNLMKRAGCWQIGFGIESGSDRVLKVLKKSQTVEQVRKAVTLADQAGMMVRGFFIIGSPTETLAEIKQSIALARELPLTDFQILAFTPFPGSEVYHKAEQLGSFDNSWQQMSHFHPVFVPHGMTPRQLIYWQNKAHQDFYLRPKILVKYLKAAIRYPRIFLNMGKAVAVISKIILANLKERLQQQFSNLS